MPKYEIYEVDPDAAEREAKVAIAIVEFPVPPMVGDVVSIPRDVTMDTEDQAFLLGGFCAPFKVLQRETVTYGTPTAATKTWLFVRRMTRDEYWAPPR